MSKIARFFIYDNMLSMGAYWICSGTVVAALTSYYAIPLSLTNILTGLPATLALLQMVGGLFYARTRRKNTFLRGSNLLWRMMLPFAFFSVLLPLPIGAVVMSLSVFVTVAVFQFSCPAQTSWMVSAVQGRVKGTYYSVREMMFMLFFSVLFCASSLLIDRSTQTDRLSGGFLLLGAVELTVLLASLPVLFALPKVAQPPVPQRQPLGTLLRPLWANKAFLKVLRVNVAWSVAGMFIGSFAAVYQIRMLHIAFSSIMVWATVGNLARSLCTPLVAKLAARITWKHTIQVMMAIMLCNAIGWMAITPSNMKMLFPVLSVLGAVPFAGLGVAFLQLQVATTQTDDRTLYFSLTATLNGLGALAGSVLCSVLIGVLETGILGADSLKYIFAVGIVGVLVTTWLAQKITCKA